MLTIACCPRCNGAIHQCGDQDGVYLSCWNCGWTDNGLGDMKPEPDGRSGRVYNVAGIKARSVGGRSQEYYGPIFHKPSHH